MLYVHDFETLRWQHAMVILTDEREGNEEWEMQPTSTPFTVL